MNRIDLSLFNKIEDANIRFNQDFWTKVVKQPDSLILLNEEIPDDPYLNYATKIFEFKKNSPFINKTEEIFHKENTPPTFYIAPYTPKELVDVLQKEGYQPFAHDAWMFFDPSSQAPSIPVENLEIKKVQTEEELDKFTEVFVEVYSKGEPDDPYQGLSPLYAKFLKKQFHRTGPSFAAEFYLALFDDEAVGTGTLFYDQEIGGLYGLGVLPKVRRLGIGKSIQSTWVRRAKELGLKYIYLVTEVGSRNEKIFTKFGFETKFMGLELTKRTLA